VYYALACNNPETLKKKIKIEKKKVYKEKFFRLWY